jgi:thermitase
MSRIHAVRREPIAVAAVVVLSMLVSSGAPAAAAPPAAPATRLPRQTTGVVIQHDGQTASVYPLKTVRTSTGRSAVADRAIVLFRDGTSAADQAAVHTKAGGRAVVDGLANGMQLVDVSGAASLDAAIAAYTADARVKGAEPDYTFQPFDLPNDPILSEQDPLTVVAASVAWDATHGDPNVKVAILDSGIYAGHPDLAGKVIASVDGTDSPFGSDDARGHGTHVAGIAAAGTNNGQGVASIGFDTRLLNVKVLPDAGEGDTWTIMGGIAWAKDHGARVINISFGTNPPDGQQGPGRIDCDPFLQMFVDDAWNNNVVLVAAVGNAHLDWASPPADCNHVLTVGSLYDGFRRDTDSNFGTWVSVVAPTGNDWSTTIADPQAECSGTLPPGLNLYGRCGYTSNAAPLVSGLAALVWASCGPIDSQGVVNRITQGAIPISGTGIYWRFGRINAPNSVCLKPPAAPANLRLGTVTPTSVQLVWADRSTAPTETSFDVTAQPVGTNLQDHLYAPRDTTTVTHFGLGPGQSYVYSVRACNAAGCSLPSNSVIGYPNGQRLSASVSGRGSVSSGPAGIFCLPDCVQDFAFGTLVMLTANAAGGTAPPKPGSTVFDHWEGDCSGSAPTCVVNMTQARTIRAVFVPLDL